ncbi:MAG TPA: triose-phosphate isomerase [Gemmatimonadales bacterium]|nr:triose-phosphate isomerase [Gemmatimonadales bacterium]
MTRPLIYAANWKMYHPPGVAAAFVTRFRELTAPREGRTLWFFPPAVSLQTVAERFADREDVKVGAQNVHWEEKGAFTGETSVAMVAGSGGSGALVGHSERRHVFGESDEETARKVRALLAAGHQAILCVGEKLEQREAGQTEEVVGRQLMAVLDGLPAHEAARLVLAYEPVWAIGTGRVAKPADAALVHAYIRTAFAAHGVAGRVPVLYGGSVNAGNVLGLVAEEQVDGVLVGGASLDAEGWAEIVGMGG